VTARTPKVSVVTVVRNARSTIGETMDSVIRQRGVDLDYWVIDGASSDGTLAQIEDRRDRITGWLSEPDNGIASAFNKGLRRARGDYVMFLNADDALADPEALARLTAGAAALDWPSVVYGDCDLIDPSSGEFLYRAAIEFDRARLLRAETLPHPGMLMHRRYFDSYGDFDESFLVAMDYELFLRGVPSTGATRIGGVVTRVRAGGVSARSRALVIEETLRALRTHGHLSALGELRARLQYALRGAARGALERAGLYGRFDAVRRRRTARRDA
jgi:glycosyltransferase